MLQGEARGLPRFLLWVGTTLLGGCESDLLPLHTKGWAVLQGQGSRPRPAWWAQGQEGRCHPAAAAEAYQPSLSVDRGCPEEYGSTWGTCSSSGHSGHTGVCKPDSFQLLGTEAPEIISHFREVWPSCMVTDQHQHIVRCQSFPSLKSRSQTVGFSSLF